MRRHSNVYILALAMYRVLEDFPTGIFTEDDYAEWDKLRETVKGELDHILHAEREVKGVRDGSATKG